MFEPRFADLVKSGKKKCTIRKKGKREVRVGDLMDARIWSGRPYWSKTVKLIESPITKVEEIVILKPGMLNPMVMIDDELIIPGLVVGIAYRDGFDRIESFIRYFRDKYELPFVGNIIHWA